MGTILQKLREKELFSVSENQIARFICASPKDAIRMSIRAISKKTYTSPTSVMRLCRKICNGGFAEFRILLAQEIETFEVNQSVTVEEENLSKKMNNLTQVMKQLESNVKDSITLTQTLLNAEIIENIVNLINTSQVIDIYGRGSSNSVGKDFRYKLFRLGYQVQMFEGLDLQAIQAYNSDSSHCAIIISSTGETPEMLNFAEILNTNGTPLITLTGSQDCSLLKNSDYPLFFKCFESNQRVGGITSRSAMQYVLDIIYFSILNSDYEKHSKTILKNYVPPTIATPKNLRKFAENKNYKFTDAL